MKEIWIIRGGEAIKVPVIGVLGDMTVVQLDEKTKLYVSSGWTFKTERQAKKKAGEYNWNIKRSRY
jgi:hypothetical protein